MRQDEIIGKVRTKRKFPWRTSQAIRQHQEPIKVFLRQRELKKALATQIHFSRYDAENLSFGKNREVQPQRAWVQIPSPPMVFPEKEQLSWKSNRSRSD